MKIKSISQLYLTVYSVSAQLLSKIIENMANMTYDVLNLLMRGPGLRGLRSTLG